MKDWLKINWRTVAAISCVSGLYVLAKFFPGLEQERELLVAITEILGLGLIGLVPSFAKPQPKPQEPPQ
jgi:hypothetical protein